MPCTPALNPLPDESYEPGHPYPDGASTAPYRAQIMMPPEGGDMGDPGEWGVVEMQHGIRLLIVPISPGITDGP